MVYNIKESSLIHPILFAIYPVLFLYSHNIYNVPLRGLFLPLLIVPLFVLSLWLVLRFVLKSGMKAGFIVSIIIIMITFYGHGFQKISIHSFPHPRYNRDCKRIGERDIVLGVWFLVQWASCYSQLLLTIGFPLVARNNVEIIKPLIIHCADNVNNVSDGMICLIITRASRGG